MRCAQPPDPALGPRPAAKTPFLGTLQLYGCVNVHGRELLPRDGQHRRRRELLGDHRAGWNIYPIPPVRRTRCRPTRRLVPGAAEPEDFHPANMVLEWPTPPLGKIVLKIEVGDATKTRWRSSRTSSRSRSTTRRRPCCSTSSHGSSPSEPDSAFGLPGRNLLVPCPTIRRGAVPQDIDVQFDVSVSAHHLRESYLYSHGCGGGDFALTSPVASTTHWHATVNDNSVLLGGRYRLDHTALEGAYGFGCRANSRAMNPAGSDNGHLLDWLYDPVYAYIQPEVEVAIVNG
jgi:hypothetical protein